MASSSSGDFHLFEAIYEAPDLLELVVQQCSGNKNNLRLACSRLRAAVDACVTGLAWKYVPFDDLGLTSRFVADFNGGVTLDFKQANGAKNMAFFARCLRLQALDFKRCPEGDFSPLACVHWPANSHWLILPW